MSWRGGDPARTGKAPDLRHEHAFHCMAGVAVLDPVVLGEDGSGDGVTPVCGV